MALDLTILYRGPLSSCNYDCSYCPFAKHRETAAELADDRQKLQRFADWLAARPNDRFSVFFTPWGEALIRPWYRDALIRLSNLTHVAKVAIQTNLSCSLEWLEQCDRRSVGLWCTYHPAQTRRGAFLAQCRRLDEAGVRYSVGVVGLREYLDEIENLRRALSSHVYLWINACKEMPEYYSEREIRRCEAVDPLFRVNLADYPSLGRSCHTGDTVVSVDGDGNVRRCHFISTKLSNIYDAGFENSLARRACTNHSCTCHIGYVHMDELNLYSQFGDGVLERIPQVPIWNGQ